MLNIYIYAAQPALATKAVEQLRAAEADHVEALSELKIPARSPKDNRYLFICESPAEKLADLTPQVLEEAAYATELSTWYEAQLKILDVYTTNKNRSILITTSQLQANPQALVEHINAQWQLQLTQPENGQINSDGKATDNLLGYLVQNLIEKTPPLHRLTASQTQATGCAEQSYGESEAIDSYRKIKAAKSAFEHQTADLQARLSDFQNLQEESELLLLQLHQVQEELERIYLESQANKETSESEKAELTAARDHHAHVAHEREQIISQLNHEKAELTAARDHHAHVAHEREQIISQLNHEKAELTAARDSEAHRANNQQEESELLLLQLHQVQEELENYFLKNQESEAKLAKQQARWTRLLKKHLDYIETESVHVAVVDEATQTLKWVVQGLESQGVAKDYLEFESFIESGVLGIRFYKTNSHNEPNLKIWPASCEGATLECITAGKGNVMRQRALVLRELSASDWKLLNTLPQLIKQNLGSAGLDAKLNTAISDAANKLTLGINALPKTFRYDSASLKANKVNPDYEHLWFELHNASFETYNWPKFEFRLGAANIKPGKFSDHPKLEIPLIDGKIKPFDSWFEESYDAYGGKYELRFDLKRGIADIETLLKLEDKEQRLVTALASCLPALLDACTVSDSKMTRPAENWKDLASATSLLVL